MSDKDLQRRNNGRAAANDGRWPNWRTLAVAGCWVSAVIGFFALSVAVDLFERINQFTRSYEKWQLDELFSLLLCVGVVSLVFLAIRTRQLAREIRRREAAEKLAHDSARHDPLTGLANGRRFREALALAIEGARQNQTNCAVLFIDLDRFKPVNDTHGHAVGDEVLMDVARQIAQAAPAGATAARLGGDEFGVIVLAVPGRESVLFLSQRLSRDIGKVRELGQARVEVGATVGIAIFPDDGGDADALINAADQAMYAAKPSRRGPVGRYDMQGGAFGN